MDNAEFSPKPLLYISMFQILVLGCFIGCLNLAWSSLTFFYVIQNSIIGINLEPYLNANMFLLKLKNHVII